MATWTFNCRNHPTYRWTKNKCGPGFIGRGVLIFHGEIGGKPASPFNYTEDSLLDFNEDFRARYRKNYTPECDCLTSDLQKVAEHGDWQKT